MITPICEYRDVDAAGELEECVTHDRGYPCNRGGLPWILLDVDGVINVFPGTVPLDWRTGDACPESGVSFEELMSNHEEAKGKLAGGWTHGQIAYVKESRKFRITWDPTIIERLVGFQESGLARIAWLTTWGEGARGELSTLMELPDFPCFHHPGKMDLHSHSKWWKFRAVEREFEDNPPEKLVWLDDDLIVEKHARNFANDRGWLAVAPPQHTGLTHDMLDQIEAYLTTTSEEFLP